MCMARRKPSANMTFGWRRLEMFGALISVLIVWLLVIILVYEAALRVMVSTRLSLGAHSDDNACRVEQHCGMARAAVVAAGRPTARAARGRRRSYACLLPVRGRPAVRSRGRHGDPRAVRLKADRLFVFPRPQEPEEVDGRLMFIVATIGLVVNIALMRVLHQAPGHGHSHGGDDHGDDHHGDDHHGHSHGGSVGTSEAGTSVYGAVASSLPAGPKESRGCCTSCMAFFVGVAFGEHGHAHGGGSPDSNMNVRAAFVHALGDLVQSIGVMIAAALIWYEPEWRIADPICTFVFALLVIWTTVGIVRDASGILLMSVPANIDTVALIGELEDLPGVANVHDLHVWALTPKDVVLTVHIVTDTPSDTLEQAQACAARYGISHSTVQVECCGSKDLENCWRANDCCELVVDTTTSGRRSASVPPSAARSRGGDAGTTSRQKLLPSASEVAAFALEASGRTTFGRRSGPSVPHHGCSVTESSASATAAAEEGRSGVGARLGAAPLGHSHSGSGGDEPAGHSHGGPASSSHGHSHGGPASSSHGHSHGGPASSSHGHSHGTGGECSGHH